jgi:hypothetical protein
MHAIVAQTGEPGKGDEPRAVAGSAETATRYDSR